MPIIDRIKIRNFKCFRAEIAVPLTQGTYLAGANNSGKSAILEAIRCFFDEGAFQSPYLNRTELNAKQEGFNRSDITIVFDVDFISGDKRQRRIRADFGNKIEIKKSISWREATDTIAVEYSIGTDKYMWESLPKDIKELISSVTVSYIHPQEGYELLKKAQDKFKQRLFHNWGRHASMAEQISRVESEWSNLRNTANSYLSAALTQRLRDIWPHADVQVDLPENIKDIVAVSDITFRSSPSLPRISLTSHGTGSQSAILYQTHYVLDSDRSLHQGQYYPIWLLEEPESFLHADIELQISKLLSSDEWLGSIQMIISTHSPIILAGSRQNSDNTSWILCDDGSINKNYSVNDVKDTEIDAVGNLMGDGNFSVYFHAARSGKQIFLEDSRKETADKIQEAGVPNPISLNGIGDVSRHLEVLRPLDGASGKCFFVVDNDEGIKSINKWIISGNEIENIQGWRKIDCGGDCYLVILPEGTAIEHIFEEWPEVLHSAFEEIFDIKRRSLRNAIPLDLTRAAAKLRGAAYETPEEAKKLLSNSQDVKDRFWTNSKSHSLSQHHQTALLHLLELPPTA